MMEFDQKAADKAAEHIFKLTAMPPNAFVFREGARWQFNRDKARIAELEAQLAASPPKYDVDDLTDDIV